ncbi:hypothetical protein MHM84_01110 [Halomonas sp. McH1-25]|uniref:hypothetical protein n=1 Tax=unclassified Halomonas TaxID=2609666 RepID=UPI001EF55611|nr:MULTISPECIES: hypothetical protein [unclassified Halomonas]MCG7598380.1 hypothetical protein [Halomonas sp. McH1-25]MCP1342678.1 hypothetical protein [Halomonas sp. FL8]MCP1362554.1 hypothetical protein [Halomonas sp. BBD45]MCP1363720.1 hypothetical protein [Halomonas sp. BBD48]
MQFTVSINQAKALEWGLNAQQSLLFAFVYECPSWAKPVSTDDGVFYALSKQKIVEELPLLTDKPDTAYRMLRALKAAGLIELSNTNSITLVRLTEKGKTWNKKLDGSDKYPTKDRKNIRAGSEKSPSTHGKKSEPGSEKSPTNQDTSNQVTNQDTSDHVATGGEPQSLVLDGGPASNDEHDDDELARVPADLPGPRDPKAKTFKAWANYAVTYRRRYGEYPIWNQRVAGQLSQLVDRVGKDLAPGVAAYFLSMNNQFYIAKGHQVGQMLQDCETIATQMRTGQQMTATRARQMDGTQANLSAVDEAKAMLRASWGDE